MYLHLLKEKYANSDNQDFDFTALKSRYYRYFWLMFAIYSVYWGTFWYISAEARNLAYVDYAVSVYLAACIALYLYVGNGLTRQIQLNYNAIEGSNMK